MSQKAIILISAFFFSNSEVTQIPTAKIFTNFYYIIACENRPRNKSIISRSLKQAHPTTDFKL